MIRPEGQPGFTQPSPPIRQQRSRPIARLSRAAEIQPDPCPPPELTAGPPSYGPRRHRVCRSSSCLSCPCGRGAGRPRQWSRRPGSPGSPGAGSTLSASPPGLAPIDADAPSRRVDPSESGLSERPSGPPLSAPTAVRPDGEDAASPGRAQPPLPLASPGRPNEPSEEGSRKAGLGAPIAGLPPTAASFDVSTLVTTAKGRARIASLAQPARPRPVTPSEPGGSGIHPPSGPGAAGRAGQSALGPAAVPGGPGSYAGPSWSALPLLPVGSVADLGTAVPLERLPSAWPQADGRDLPDYARPAPRDADSGLAPERLSHLVTAGHDPAESPSPSLSLPSGPEPRPCPRPVAGWSGPPGVHRVGKSAGWSRGGCHRRVHGESSGGRPAGPAAAGGRCPPMTVVDRPTTVDRPVTVVPPTDAHRVSSRTIFPERPPGEPVGLPPAALPDPTAGSRGHGLDPSTTPALPVPMSGAPAPERPRSPAPTARPSIPARRLRWRSPFR